MTRLLVPIIVVLVALAVAAALWTPDNDSPQTPTTTTGVIRSQGGESSPTTRRVEPGWRLPNRSCVRTSPELAEQVGAVRDPECDR